MSLSSWAGEQEAVVVAYALRGYPQSDQHEIWLAAHLLSMHNANIPLFRLSSLYMHMCVQMDALVDVHAGVHARVCASVYVCACTCVYVCPAWAHACVREPICV